jgi:hypothetical protein
MYLKEHGHKVLDNGWQIAPIKAGSKAPIYPNWQAGTFNHDDLDRATANGHADGGIGILTGEVRAVDIDVEDKAIASALYNFIRERYQTAPIRKGRAPRFMAVFRADQVTGKQVSKTYEDFAGVEHKIEVLGKGQQFVAFHIHPKTGKPYVWRGVDPTKISPKDLPVFTQADIEALFAKFDHLAAQEGWAEVRSSSDNMAHIAPEDRALAAATPPLNIDLTTLKKHLRATRHLADSRDDWYRVGMALYHQFDGGVEGLELWEDWSQNSSKYRPGEPERLWRGFSPSPGTRPVTFASVIKMAQEVSTKPAERNTKVTDRTGDPGPVSKFKFVTADEVRRRVKATEWVIKHYLEADTTGLLFGAPQAYKSFLALDWSLCVGTGKAWQGHKVKQGPVFYINGEGFGGIAKRVEVWCSENDIDLDGADFFFSERAAQFYDEESAQDVIEAIEEMVAAVGEPPRLVTIDTLARNFGGDENSTGDMNLFIDRVDNEIRARWGCTVLIVHHTGVSNAKRARGSSALGAAMDFSFLLERSDMDSMQSKLTGVKMKDGAIPAPVFLDAKEITIVGFEDEDGEPLTSLVLEKGAAPVEREAGPSGRMGELWRIILREHPVRRDDLTGIALAEIQPNSDLKFETREQVNSAFQKLKARYKLVDVVDGDVKLLVEEMPS